MGTTPEFSETLAAIYDAAIAPEGWDAALVAIARTLGATQSALMVLDDGILARGHMPLMGRDKLRTYAQIKAEKPTPLPSVPVALTPLGKVCGFDECYREVFRASAEFQDWWREHDLGLNSLFANVSRSGGRVAQIAIYRGADGRFSSVEQQSFSQICAHLVRALAIEQRLELGQAGRHVAGEAGEAPFLLVDSDYRIVFAADDARELAGRLKVTRRDARGGEYLTRSRHIRDLVDRARPPGCMAGSCIVGEDGAEQFWLDAAPVDAGEQRAFSWLNVERPVTLLRLIRPHGSSARRIAALATEYGWTRAEIDVVREIIAGDGRKAAGARLGITVSRVRSHLTAIYDKSGVRRQSDLINMIGA